MSEQKWNDDVMLFDADGFDSKRREGCDEIFLLLYFSIYTNYPDILNAGGGKYLHF